MTAVRMAVLWCPDWPVVAWGVPLDEPAIVVVGNRVVASSPAAREEGVARGQRRRDAQSRCPDVAVLERDVGREVRLFEPVVDAIVEVTPRVEVAGPGIAGFPTKGPSRFFGGDKALASTVLDRIVPVLAKRGEGRIAIADGMFAARLAARSANLKNGPVIVPVGESPAFLGGFPIAALEQPDLTDVLGRLGLSTLGAFAKLASADVVGRFGKVGQLAHRLARGEDDHPPDLRRPAPNLAVTWVFEPVANRIDQCAYAAKALADELNASLVADGLACIRVAIEAETHSGEEHVRLWRHDGALSSAAIAERARWQLEGWLGMAVRTSGKTGDQADDDRGIRRLTLVPDEVVPADGRQLGLWGGRAERADDVTRVVARIQALMGAEAVLVPEWRGGRGPADQITLIPAAAVDLGEERVATGIGWVDEPWPGKVPAPAPSKVLLDQPEIEVVDTAGKSVVVGGRGELSSPPAIVIMAKKQWAVSAWAGPWPADERWWDPLTQRRRARLQVKLEDQSAHLLIVERQAWYLEATY